MEVTIYIDGETISFQSGQDELHESATFRDIERGVDIVADLMKEFLIEMWAKKRVLKTTLKELSEKK